MHSILYVCMYITIGSEQQSRSKFCKFCRYKDQSRAHWQYKEMSLTLASNVIAHGSSRWESHQAQDNSIKRQSLFSCMVLIFVCKCSCFTSRRRGIFVLFGLRLVQATPPQIISYNDVSYGIEYKLDVISICCACLVTVDLLRWTFVLRFKLGLNVGSCLFIGLISCKRKT